MVGFTSVMTGTCADASSVTDDVLFACLGNSGTCSDDHYSNNWYCSCPFGRSGVLCENEIPGT